MRIAVPTTSRPNSRQVRNCFVVCEPRVLCWDLVLVDKDRLETGCAIKTTISHTNSNSGGATIPPVIAVPPAPGYHRFIHSFPFQSYLNHQSQAWQNYLKILSNKIKY